MKKKIVKYKTNDPEYVLPTQLYDFAEAFADEVIEADDLGMEKALFIDTFRSCFQAMQIFGMVKKKYLMADKPIDFENN